MARKRAVVAKEKPKQFESGHMGGGQFILIDNAGVAWRFDAEDGTARVVLFVEVAPPPTDAP